MVRIAFWVPSSLGRRNHLALRRSLPHQGYRQRTDVPGVELHSGDPLGGLLVVNSAACAIKSALSRYPKHRIAQNFA